MLEASHITIMVGTKILIDDLSFVLNKKEKRLKDIFHNHLSFKERIIKHEKNFSSCTML